MDAYVDGMSSGRGRRQSSPIDSSLHDERPLVIEEQSAQGGAEMTAPSAVLQNKPFTTISTYSDLYQEAPSPPYSDLNTAAYTTPQNAQDIVNSPNHNSLSRTHTRSDPSSASPNPLPSSTQTSLHPIPGRQRAVQFTHMHQEQQQQHRAPLPAQSLPDSQTHLNHEHTHSHSQSPITHPTVPTMPTALRNIDTISLRSLSTQAILGPDSWARPKPQPILLSLYLTTDTASAGRTDNIAQTFSYGIMAKSVISKIEGKGFLSIDHMTSDLASLADEWPGETLRITARAPKALLRTSEGLERELLLQRRKSQSPEGTQSVWHVLRHEWAVGGLRVACIIGVNEHERVEKQDVVVRIRAMGEREKEDYGAQVREGGEMWRRLVRGVCDVIEPSSFKTLEALAAHVARYCLQHFPFPQVTVGIEKPSALTFVEGAGVEVTRDRTWLSTS